MIDIIGASWEVGGKTATVVAILSITWNKVAEFIPIETINPYVAFTASAIALFYMLSKWKGQRLSNKQKAFDLEESIKLRERRENRQRGDGQEGK